MQFLLTQLGIVCALGNGEDEILKNVVESPLIGMKKRSYGNIDTVFGTVSGIEESGEIRANLLLKEVCLQLDISKIKSRYSSSRIGIVLGLTNTGVGEAQEGILELLSSGKLPEGFDFSWLNLNTPTEYLKNLLGLEGPCYTVSTACSSSSKVFLCARSMIESSLCDCVIVGGVDAFCSFALCGFRSLEALSKKQTNPMSKNRDGINLGEGACLFVMEADRTKACSSIKLKGVGESSDAYHITSPDPEGVGAYLAMSQALEDSGLSSKDIDYINLHGTGTIHNDSMEALAISKLFNKDLPCSSTKPMSGHTLGASGAVELGFSYIMLKNNCLFPHIYDGIFDENIVKLNLVESFCKKEITNIMSNSFGFAGSNASVIIGK